MIAKPKVSLFLAISINGIIAYENDDVPWTEPIWSEYFKLVKSSDALVVGKRTYELMATTNEIEELHSVPTAILTRNVQPPKDNLIFFSEPQQIIQHFQQQGFTRVIVGGGPQTNSLFLRAGLIDEVILDTFPILMPSTGKLLFTAVVDSLLPRHLKPTRNQDLGDGCFRHCYDLV